MTDTTAIAITIAEFCAERFGAFRIVDNRAYDGYDVAKEAANDAIAAIDAEVTHVLRAYPTSRVLEVTEEVEGILAELEQARADVVNTYEYYRNEWWLDCEW